MSLITVDIDSTLYDFAQPMRQAFLDLALEHDDKEEYFRGGYQSWVEWRSPADVCGMDAFLKALARVHSPEVILAQQPFIHSQDVLSDLAQIYELVYISNRSPDRHEVTGEWLDRCGYPEGHLICTMEDKMALSHVQQSRYIIDDRPKTLVQFVYDFTWQLHHALPQRKGFGLLYEYNRALTDIPNVYLAPTWNGIRYYLERKGVLDGRSISTSK